MTKFYKKKFLKKDLENELDGICEECQQIDESVNQNLILNGFKLCSSCSVSKTLFPV
tara:strand:- start:1037 stop:1207 length:171 start_codon:yes stop_codon:yes gene_type:complete